MLGALSLAVHSVLEHLVMESQREPSAPSLLGSVKALCLDKPEHSQGHTWIGSRLWGLSYFILDSDKAQESSPCCFYTCVFVASPCFIYSCFQILGNLHISCTYACKRKKGVCTDAISPFSCRLMEFARIHSPLLKGENRPFVYICTEMCIWDVVALCWMWTCLVNGKIEKVLCLFIHLYKSIYTRMYMCVYR